MRTLLLGLDGLDPELVDEWDLPNIESIGEGRVIDTHGNSGPSWASVLTGLTPQTHGVHKLKPQSNSQSWQGKPIWEKIDGYSGIANVPLTYPPQEIQGWMVTSLMTPEKAIYTYPRDLYKKLDGLNYRIDVWVDNHKNHPKGHYGTIPFEFSQAYRDELLEEIDDVIENRTKAFCWLMENEPVDFLFLCYTSLDRVQHLIFDDKFMVKRYYKKIDRQVGKILEETPPDTEIFVNSDHGFQEIDMPDTDIKGEHREEGYGATNTDKHFSNLEQLHEAVVNSANRNTVAEERLDDLGYL